MAFDEIFRKLDEAQGLNGKIVALTERAMEKAREQGYTSEEEMDTFRHRSFPLPDFSFLR